MTPGGSNDLYTWYVRDAQGNVMGVYQNLKEDAPGEWWMEQHLYGNSRIGMWRPEIDVTQEDGETAWNTVGITSYELTNHLGNVLSVIRDKPPVNNNPEVLSQNDYYPFGMMMPGRKYSLSVGYRYGFNGKERESEVYSEGNTYDFGARIYNPRIGRWFTIDNLAVVYTSISPYSFSANNAVNLIDEDGNILRDKNGNIIATSDGNTVFERTFGVGEVSYAIKYRKITIYTDRGTPVSAELVVGFVKKTIQDGKINETAIDKLTINGNIATSESVKSNCHGYTFSKGSLIIGDGRANILNDEYEYLGKSTSLNQDIESEKYADIVVIYGSVFDESAGIDEGFWYHVGNKEPGGTWTDKDDYTQVRKGLKSSKEVENSPLKSSGEKERLFYRRRSDRDKIIRSLPEIGRQSSDIRIISEEEKEKILSSLNNEE